MGNSNRKIYVGKSIKKIAKKVIVKTSDPYVRKLDLKIRCAKALHFILKKTYQISLNPRSSKQDRMKDPLNRNEKIMKTILNYSKPIQVLQSEIAKDEFKFDKSNGLVALTKNNLLNSVFSGSVSMFDQEYRNKTPLSRLFKSYSELLPSPATFGLHSAGFNEASKFLQEKALILMESFVKHNIDSKSNHSYAKKTDDILKCCSQCKNDFSAAWIPVDIRKTLFICEKCNSKRRRIEFSKLNILNLYPECSPSLPHSVTTLGTSQKPSTVQFNHGDTNKNRMQAIVTAVTSSQPVITTATITPKYELNKRLVERPPSVLRPGEGVTLADRPKQTSNNNNIAKPVSYVNSSTSVAYSQMSSYNNSTNADVPPSLPGSKNLPRLILNTNNTQSPFYVRSSMAGPPVISSATSPVPVQNFQVITRTPRTYYIPISQHLTPVQTNNQPRHRSLNYNTYHYFPTTDPNSSMHTSHSTVRGSILQQLPISHSSTSPASIPNQKPIVYRAPGLQVMGFPAINEQSSQNIQQIKQGDMFVVNRK